MCREVTLKEVAMKRYTGNLVIELEDQNTGTIETVSETNMVTNAVNDILGVNPMGVMYKAGGQYDDSLTWNQELLPICPNMIGGILLFPSSITEQADNLYIEEEDGHGVTTAVYWFDEESRALVPVSKTFSIYDYQSLKKVAGVQDYSPKESGSQWKLYDSQSDSYIPFECNRISLMFK
jgi:hypothetical protein